MNQIIVSSLVLSLLICQCFSADPTNYQYFTNGGIKSGLKADSVHFTLNGKRITLLSGSLHYFRLPHQYWKDRLTKFRAAGLNAVQTLTPWNIHEDTQGQFDFETGYLNLANFLKAAKEADLFVLIRIGPFICAEWELGGYPAWLLKDKNMKFRSNYKPHLDATLKYHNKLLSIINDYQFTKGGPIIALQYENEFGGIRNENDKEYFDFLKHEIEKSGFKELLLNCDGANDVTRAVKTIEQGTLETINFNTNVLANLKVLRDAQPNKPLYVSEYWPAWFDSWGDKTHHRMNVHTFEKDVTDILFVANASINFYMFFGGTNFGFMNGANVVTSYDYDAPLSESANYTDKYWKTKQLIANFVEERRLPKTHIPKPPKAEAPVAYGEVKVKDYLSMDDLLKQIKPIDDNFPHHMEHYGQNFGFILYRIKTQKFKHVTIHGGVSDRGIVIVDNKQYNVIFNSEYQMNFTDSQFANTTSHHLDILVENTGRPNIGDVMNHARRGINGDVLIDDKKVSKYEVYPMEFKQTFVQSLKHLNGRAVAKVNSPSLFRAELHISGQPRDTFLRLDKWTKGSVFVNGFNIGRYFDEGPQHTLYVPAPLLKTEVNDIYIFEIHANLLATDKINFVDRPDLGK